MKIIIAMAPLMREVIVDISKEVLKSYKSLPINLYQIQTKFRDEIRPRYGVMRARVYYERCIFFS